MFSKFCRFSGSVLLIILGITCWVAAQETAQKVNIQSSPLSVRSLGQASIARSISQATQSTRSQATSSKQSPFATIHNLAHHWGRVMTANKTSAIVPQPPVTPSPIIGPDKNFSGFAGLTGDDQASVSGFDLEPPDQGLCTDGNFVMEAVNIAASIYSASTHKLLAGPVYLNNFFGVAASDFTSDPRCYYDNATQRWFVSLTDLGGPTNGGTDLLFAVSTSSDPTGTYNLYAIDTLFDGFFGVCPCFGDQPLIGADDNGFYISTNSFGTQFFGGAQIYALSKFDLILGLTPFGLHLTPLPGGGGLPYPFSLQPSASPDGHGAPENGGTEYFVSSYDINSLVNNKVSVWAMTDTDTLNAAAGLPGFTTVAVNTETYVVPVVSAQKAGPIPLGTSLGFSEGTLNPDDQRMQQVTYVNGKLWGTVDTSAIVGRTFVDAAAYFVITPSWSGGVLKASVATQGYVAAANDNLLYPAVAVGTSGKGAMVFTLVGPDYFPSAAYIPISLASGPAANGIRLAAAGSAPDDGFTCYPPYGGPPGRWGDYSAAAVVGDDDSVWLATEYISNKPRDKYTNWGTFVGKLPLPDND